MLSSPHSPNSSSEEASTSEETPLSSSSSPDGLLVSAPGDLPEHDARTSLALFEGHGDEDEIGARNGEAPKSGALEMADDASIRDFYAQLVNLLTSDNAAPAPKPANRSSLRFVLRRRALPALLVAGLTFVGLAMMLRPHQIIYTSQADILLPPHVQGGDPLAPPETSYDTSAQVAIIGSEELRQSAFLRLKPDVRLRGWGTKEAIAPNVVVYPASAAETNGSLVEISVASMDEEASTRMAVEVANAYAQRTASLSTRNNKDNLDTTQAQVTKIGAQLKEARAAKATLQIQSEVGDPGSALSSVSQTIESLQTQIATERGNAATALTTDSAIAQLEESLRTAQTEYQTVIRDFFPDSQQARAAQAKISAAQAAISARQGAIRAASDARIAQLEGALRQAQTKARVLPNLQRNRDQLDQNIAILASQFQDANQRLSQLRLLSGVVTQLPKVLNTPSTTSSKTIQRIRALFIAMLGALSLGLLTALLADRLDRTVRATSDPEALWNAPVLGALPASDESEAFFRATPSNQKVNPRAKTQSIEACYLAQSNILALAEKAGVRSILFSSALKNEGKATAAANLAVAMAYGGRETLFIDADFWNPTQHKNFGVPLSPGYAQVLRDQMPLSEAIRPTTVNNLYLLTPGQDASQGMGSLMSRLQGAPHTKNMNLLKKYFDVIVVDGPAATTLEEAQLLSHLADAVVLVSSENTPRAEVQRARSMLRLSGAFLLGVVLNRVRGSEVSDWNLQFTPEGK